MKRNGESNEQLITDDGKSDTSMLFISWGDLVLARFYKESVGSNSSFATIATISSDQDQDQPPSMATEAAQNTRNMDNLWMSPPQTQHQVQNSNGVRNNREKDTCFRCKKQGHWAVHCPTKSPSPSPPLNLQSQPQTPPQSSSPYRSQTLTASGFGRCLLCPCGAVCSSKISRTAKNPGRQFYVCPVKGPRCLAFKWADMVKDEEMVNIPVCSCRAGISRVYTDEATGRKFFICNIEKGSGACSFCQPMDTYVITANSRADSGVSSLESTVISSSGDDGGTSPARDFIDEREGDLNNKGTEIGSSSLINNPPSPDSLGTTSGQMKRGKEQLVQLEEQEDTSSEKLSKRLRHETPNINCSVTSSFAEHMQKPNMEVEESWMEEEITLVSQLEISHRQKEFLKQMSLAEINLPASTKSCNPCSSAQSGIVTQTLATTATYHIDADVRDWLGKLVYSPHRCLTSPTPKPFYCCIFPSFDEVPATKDSSIVSSGALKIPSKFLYSPSSSKKTPSLDNPVIVGDNFMTTVISEEFGQLAMLLQNKLLTLLESMDFHDHSLMVKEATNTFNALERLGVGFQALREKVDDFIERASLLAGIESSVSDDGLSHTEAVGIYNREKQQWDEICCAETKAKAELEACKKRVEVVSEETDRIRERLRQLETEHSRCKAEEDHLEHVYNGMSKEKMDQDRRLDAAAGAMEACKRKEEERDVAKAAFDKAKLLLRQ